jgi:hypothetical protein
MESMHGVLEWFIMALIAPVGFVIGRWVPYRRARYAFYALALPAAFIMDLNKAAFRSDALNLLLYALILAAISEAFCVCVRKKSRLLLCGALAALTPVFLYVYAAALLIVPLPCHENRNELVDEYSACPAGTYVLTKRLSFDPFNPAQVYVLSRDVRRTPLKKQVDKYPAPEGYIEAKFTPRWECKEDGKAKVHLYIDGYTLWSLEEKAEE